MRRRLCQRTGTLTQLNQQIHKISNCTTILRTLKAQVLNLCFQVYCGEIAEKSIRGTLGSFFQLFVVTGILLVYILGWIASPMIASLICGIIPIIFGVCVFFCPESPTYLVSCKNASEVAQSYDYLYL